MSTWKANQVYGLKAAHLLRFRYVFLCSLSAEFSEVLRSLYEDVFVAGGNGASLKGAAHKARLNAWCERFSFRDRWLSDSAGDTLRWWATTVDAWPNVGDVPKGLESNHPGIQPSWSSPGAAENDLLLELPPAPWTKAFQRAATKRLGHAVKAEPEPEYLIHAWDPQRDTESGFRARIEQHIRQRRAWAKEVGLEPLDARIAPRFNGGLSSVWTPSKKLPQHCRWLARRLVARESPKTIAGKSKATAATIEDATTSLARALGLTGYQLPRGRPRKTGGS